ncbi:glutathione S-transferase [Coccidioides immitis RS]|uniref:Glutathione S-transferase n=1 Tax=Coccidioides immitis (strain RS) TaxID=246410 RepID=J3KLF1_COCIM|nr:glutathione S-transferase [Coccidioides immitis RS]EAS37101.3 glutathione S-transferase [Coccidioides immitis RS]
MAVTLGPSSPDADIHPIATGPAKEVVEKHSSEQPFKFYAGWFCPFVQKTWIVLEEKQIPYQYIEVNASLDPSSLLSLNPRGPIPTLYCPQPNGSKPLYESNIINEYLDDVFSSHQPHLFPLDPYKKARAKTWVDFVTSRIIPSFNRFLQAQGEGEIAKAHNEFLGHLKEFIDAMDSSGPYFFGEDFTMPDVALAPWAMRLWLLDHLKGGLRIPEPGEGGEDEQVWERWREWVDAVGSRNSVANTLSEKEYYLPIYKKVCR